MTDHDPPAAGVPTCYRHPDRESHIRCQRCDRPICPDCMRDAAVGFQCPSCVAEGKKTTRSGRTPFGGLRPTNAGMTSFVLIGINVAVWVAILVTGGAASRLVHLFALTPVGQCVPNGQSGYYPGAGSELVCGQIADSSWVMGVSEGAYWQLITSAFTHEQVFHIGFNMFALYVLGPQLELAIGRARFLSLYLLSALTGSALVYWAAPVSQSTVGASGAIFGLMGGLLVVALKVRANPQQILMWIGINAFLTVLVPGISWQGHLGGLVGGVLVGGVIAYAPRGPRRTLFQVSGLVAIAALTALAVIARTAALA